MALPCTTEMGDIIDKIYEFDGEKFFKNLFKGEQFYRLCSISNPILEDGLKIGSIKEEV